MSDTRIFHTSKVRIEEPAVSIGGTYSLSTNPLRVAGVISSDVTKVRIIVEKEAQAVLDKNLFAFSPVGDGNKSFSTDEITDSYDGIYRGIYLPSAGDYRIRALAYGGSSSSTFMGEDFVNVVFKPDVYATVVFPVEAVERYMLSTSVEHPELFSVIYQNGTYQLEWGWIALGFGAGALMQIGGARFGTNRNWCGNSNSGCAKFHMEFRHGN